MTQNMDVVEGADSQADAQDADTQPAEFYRVSSGVHRNVANLTMTIGNRPYQLYTDADGILREVRDGEGHPFISAPLALALKEFPARDGWVIQAVGPDEPEPPLEVIPVEVNEYGHIRPASGATLVGKLGEAVQSGKRLETMVELGEETRKQLAARLEEVIRERDQWRARAGELEAQLALLQEDRPIVSVPEDEQQPPAPMIGKSGKLTRARRGKLTEVLADDSSVATLQLGDEPEPPVGNDLDDIPRT